jgi:hypothetical protein
MNEKEVKENNCMLLTKFSKTVKALIEYEDSYTPWPLKSQIDYNLTPVTDFLLSLKAISSTTLTTSCSTSSMPSTII